MLVRLVFSYAFFTTAEIGNSEVHLVAVLELSIALCYSIHFSQGQVSQFLKDFLFLASQLSVMKHAARDRYEVLLLLCDELS